MAATKNAETNECLAEVGPVGKSDEGKRHHICPRFRANEMPKSITLTLNSLDFKRGAFVCVRVCVRVCVCVCAYSESACVQSLAVFQMSLIMRGLFKCTALWNYW